ncbi:hypothetical protein PFISCL1PPCAC_14581, partial [Pristionchus fissidentatus]
LTPAPIHLAPPLTRAGFSKQAEFNCSVLNRLEQARKDPSLIDGLIETIKERNAALTMADKNPKLLEVMETARAFEGSASATSPLMQAMVLAQSLANQNERKRRATSPLPQPFRTRASAYGQAGAQFTRMPSLIINIPMADNRLSARREAEFVRSEVARLLASGAIERCPFPRVVSPLSVAQGKKLRLIHDLSALNLGYEIDLREGTVRVSEDRISKALERLVLLREEDSPSVRDRNRAVGSLMSASLVLGDSATLLSRSLLQCIAESQQQHLHPNTRLPLSHQEKGEIEQWLRELRDRATRKFVESPWQIDKRVETDASAIGLGVVVRDGDEGVKRTSRNLSPAEKEESSTLSELRAVEFAVDTFEKEWKGLNVVFFGDNKSAMTILKKGSMKPELHGIALRVEAARVRTSASFKFHWIPRELNTDADLASRDLDMDDWSLQGWVFDQAVKRWGAPQYDMFADDKNSKCERFISRHACRGAIGVDAFADSRLWSTGGLLWCVPPPSLLCRTLAWMRGTRTTCILGLPYWTSHPVFTSLFPPHHSPPFVKDYIMYPEGSHVLIPGSYERGPFSRPFMDSPFCLLLLDFN